MADGSSNAVLVREYYAPVMLGTILATFLFGVNTSQSVTYLNYRRNDPWLTQVMVAVLLTMCGLQVGFSLYTLWFFSVENFGNYSALSIQSWASTISLGVFMAIISVSVQQYFIWRVKIFTKSWLVFGVLSMCSVTAGALGFINACTSVALDDPALVAAETGMVNTTLAINTFVNVANAALLLYYLLRHRTGFQRTDSVIQRLVITCVESPLLIALLSLADIVTFKTTYPTNWTLIVAIPLGQVYMLAVLALLNSRASLRATWNGVTNVDCDELERSNRLMHFKLSAHDPVRVGVTVEQHAHVEVDPFAGRVKSGRPRGKANKANTATTSAGSDVKVNNEHEMTDFSIAMHALNTPEDDEKKIAVVA